MKCLVGRCVEGSQPFTMLLLSSSAHRDMKVLLKPLIQPHTFPQITPPYIYLIRRPCKCAGHFVTAVVFVVVFALFSSVLTNHELKSNTIYRKIYSLSILIYLSVALFQVLIHQ